LAGVDDVSGPPGALLGDHTIKRQDYGITRERFMEARRSSATTCASRSTSRLHPEALAAARSHETGGQEQTTQQSRLSVAPWLGGSAALRRCVGSLDVRSLMRTSSPTICAPSMKPFRVMP